jgi:hypothetical protein
LPTHTRTLFILLSMSLFLPLRVHAQLNKTFSSIFTEILDVRLQRSGSPGQHGTHFLESADRANNELVPALNSLIAGNISSFPLSSTSAGALFDFSTGVPVPITESSGPIFAENAKTLGRGKFLLNANFTFARLSHFRGIPTEDMKFTFTHKDVTNDATLGENPNESDLIDLALDLHADVGIGVVFATYGLTSEMDVSVAVPIVSVRLTGTSNAVIESYTFGRLGHANHLFGGDTLHPVLTTAVPYNQSAAGLGDVALRLKYCFARGGAMDIAALADIRFPTGKKEDFLGAGKTAFHIWGILSRPLGDVTPHLNLGYVRNAGDLQSDAFAFRAGFDSKLSSVVTFALDVLGQIDLNASKAIHLAPGTVTIADLAPGAASTRTVRLSNIPDRSNDNTVSLSAGLRFAPSSALNVFGNIFVPLNEGGLRATVAPTLGFSLLL